MYKGFSRVIYSILNGSAILERNETRLERNETRLERNETHLERNETRLARNETRGGKLPLSGTVDTDGFIELTLKVNNISFSTVYF